MRDTSRYAIAVPSFRSEFFGRFGFNSRSYSTTSLPLMLAAVLGGRGESRTHRGLMDASPGFEVRAPHRGCFSSERRYVTAALSAPRLRCIGRRRTRRRRRAADLLDFRHHGQGNRDDRCPVSRRPADHAALPRGEAATDGRAGVRRMETGRRDSPRSAV